MRTFSVAPGLTAVTPVRASTLACRNTSPPPVTSTKPKPFSALNHLTTAVLSGPVAGAAAIGGRRWNEGMGVTGSGAYSSNPFSDRRRLCQLSVFAMKSSEPKGHMSVDAPPRRFAHDTVIHRFPVR